MGLRPPLSDTVMTGGPPLSDSEITLGYGEMYGKGDVCRKSFNNVLILIMTLPVAGLLLGFSVWRDHEKCPKEGAS